MPSVRFQKQEEEKNIATFLKTSPIEPVSANATDQGHTGSHMVTCGWIADREQADAWSKLSDQT